MKNLIKKILIETIDDKLLNLLISKYGGEFIYSKSGADKLHDLGFDSNEIEEIKNILDEKELKVYSEKIDEYVELYHQNPILAKERFLKDVIINVSNKRIGTKLYNMFLKKLSKDTGEVYSRKYGKPDRSKILMKIAKYLEEPSEEPKTRSGFLRKMGVPMSHYSTTFTRLYDNGLLKQTIKNGKKVLELGPNFQKFISGEPAFTEDMEDLFEEYIIEYGLNLEHFHDRFRPLFYKSSDYIKFLRSFKKYINKIR
jgi:hypothetical protein